MNPAATSAGSRSVGQGWSLPGAVVGRPEASVLSKICGINPAATDVSVVLAVGAQHAAPGEGPGIFNHSTVFRTEPTEAASCHATHATNRDAKRRPQHTQPSSPAPKSA